MNAISKLEALGLGKAPFRVVGFCQIPSTSLAEQNPSAYNNALAGLPRGVGVGSCAICSTGIMNNFLIRSADGKTHAVGCDCVLKINDVRLTSDLKIIQKQQRDAVREAARQAKFAAQQAALAAERERNGGATDYEVAQAAARDARLAVLAPKIAALAPLADELADGRNGFCDSIAASMRDGQALVGRAALIVCDVLAKRCGRSGSKSYNARYDEVSAVFESIQSA